MKKKPIFILINTLFFTCLLNAQQIDVSGTVTSAEDETPLPGVNVVVKGTTTGSITDLNGGYKIAVSPTDTLLFSFVGYEVQQALVNNRTIINVQLSPSLEALEEVLVIGYGETTRKKFTGSLTSVSGDEIVQAPQQSAIGMIQGRAAGVQVSDNSGQPGSTPSILIRGLGTLRTSGTAPIGTYSISSDAEGNSTTGPLYVIDGIPASNFNSFNPSDIESITVLKDAASTSIYGSRAAAGVVLITTKKGKAGKTRFNFDAQYGFSDIENPNDFDLMNAEEYLDYNREAALNAGINPDDPNSGAYYLPLDGDYYDTDWFDLVTRTAITQRYELSATGGTDKTTFYTSLSYLNEEGIVKGMAFSRVSGRLNLKHKVSEKIEIDMKVFGSANDEDFDLNGGGGRSAFLSGSYNVSPLKSPYADTNTPAIFNGLGYNFDLPSNAQHNPVAAIELTENNFKEYRAMPSLRIDFKPINNLKLWASASYDLTYYEEKTSMSKYYEAETEDGLAESIWAKSINSNYNTVAEYNYAINKDHEAKILLGGEVFKEEVEQSEAGSQTFGFDAINNFAAGGATSTGQLEYAYEGNTLVSVFSRLDYTYKDKLFIHGSFRRDGSSRFGPENRWGNFYAFGGGYSLSDEDFISSIRMISNLKLKASYGIAGNPAARDFEWRNTYDLGGAYNNPAGPNSGTIINSPGNPFLKWEQSAQTNAGVEFGLLNEKISGNIEYYIISTIDLISERKISQTSGYEDIIDNIAKIKNNGIEVSLYTRNISISDFTWTTSLNFTKNNNEVVELANDVDTLVENISQAHIKGQSAFQWYMPTYAGVDPGTGRPMYYDESGNLTFNYNNAVIEVQGSHPIYAPDFYGSVTNAFSYKGITLSVMLYYNYGGKIYRGLYRGLMTSGGGANQSDDLLNRWRQPGDITHIPKADAGYNDPGPSSRWLEDASYIRLRNVGLSYSLPDYVVEKIRMSGLTISIRGVNLLTWTAYNGMSVTTGAVEQGSDYPTPRTLTFGINAKF